MSPTPASASPSHPTPPPSLLRLHHRPPNPPFHRLPHRHTHSRKNGNLAGKSRDLSENPARLANGHLGGRNVSDPRPSSRRNFAEIVNHASANNKHYLSKPRQKKKKCIPSTQRVSSVSLPHFHAPSKFLHQKEMQTSWMMLDLQQQLEPSPL